MGYFVNVEPGVNLYVEDINPGGQQNHRFYTWLAVKP